MSLHQLLQEWSLPALELDQPRLTGEFIRRNAGKLTTTPRVDALGRIHFTISTHWQRYRRLDSLPRKLKNKIPWVLFFPADRTDTWLGSEDGFFRSYSDLFLLSLSRTAVRRLISSLLHSWPDTQCPLFDQWCDLGVQGLEWAQSPFLSVWLGRHRELGVFGRRGPASCAQYLLAQPNTRSELEAWGFSGMTALWRFFDQLLLAMSQKVSGIEMPRAFEAALITLIPILETEQSGQLRFPSRAAQYVSLLLSPCVNGGSIPCTNQLRQVLQAFSLSHLEDPRLKPGRWESVDQAVLEMVLYWLTEDSIELFLKVISEYAPAHQWRRRRALWRKYFKMGIITEAWVILGRSAERALRRHAGHTHLEIPAHATLVGAALEQSALLMRVGGWTILEWSHSGACRFYRPGARTAPAFYAPSYDAYALRAAGYEERIVHMGDHWIEKIDRYIEEEILP